jgi:hypothetical protein
MKTPHSEGLNGEYLSRQKEFPQTKTHFECRRLEAKDKHHLEDSGAKLAKHGISQPQEIVGVYGMVYARGKPWTFLE